MKHLWAYLNSKPKEWKKITKVVHVIDYLVKNGAPRVIQDIKDDLYKIRQFEHFKYQEGNGPEQGHELRDKVKALVELMNEPGKLQYEREFAKQTREKFIGIASDGYDGSAPSKNKKNSAAPASGQYGGFGSEDIAKFGYNNDNKFGDQGAYDPYTKDQSINSAPQVEKEKPKKEKEEKEEPKITPKYTKQQLEDDSESDLSSIDSIDSDNTKKKKKRQQKKKAKAAKEKAAGIKPAPTAPV